MADRNDMNRMSSEEYTELKKQEKAEVFELLSDATQKLLSGDRLKEYADKQAQLFKHSVSNVLLIMEQAPEATWVRSYDDWKADGVTVLKGETGIKTLGSYRFQKENGTLGMGSKVVKMFDVKQTVIKDFDIVSLNYNKAPDAIMATFPAAVEVPELPDGAYALYDHNDKLIRVKEGLDPATKIFVVAREHAVEIMTGNDYNTREAVIRQAEMSAYILTKHYGFDAPEIDFGRISSEYPGKEEKDVRAQLGIIKHVADSIDLRVQEVLELGRETKSRDDREER